VSIDNTDISKGPYIFLALFAFAVGEPIRYFYYLVKSFELEYHPIGRVLGHIRYNLFIVVYPIGATCDGLASYYSTENNLKSGIYSYLMPNQLNVAFSYAWFTGTFVPVMYTIMLPINYYYLLQMRSKYYKTMAEYDKKAKQK
jgi:hypothetical protein